MKKILIFLTLLLSFNSYGEEKELDFSSDIFCDKSPKAQVRNGLFYLPNQEEPYSGENICVYLSNGQYSSKGEIKDGLRHGSWSYWKENGQNLNDKLFFEDEVISETKYEYYENGQIQSKATVKDGELDGLATSWYENGQKWMEGAWKDGDIAFIKSWYENGQNQAVGYFKNLVPDGNWMTWFENGLQSGEGNFKDGTGQFIEFYENNQKLHEMVYQDGIGKETRWYEDGQIRTEKHYKDGKLDGKSTVWNENGQIDLEEIYKDDELVSEINHKAEREAKAYKAKLKAEADRDLAEQKAQAEAARELAEEKAREAEEKRKVEEEKAKLAEKEKDEAKRLAEEERIRLYELEAERTAQQLAFENEQYNRLLTQEGQAEQDQERLVVIEDQRNTLKSAYVGNIAARIRSFWRYQGAEDDWSAEVYVLQDRDGKVLAVDVRKANVDDSSKAKVFKDSIRRAVYKASPLPSAPDESVFDRELIITFSVN